MIISGSCEGFNFMFLVQDSLLLRELLNTKKHPKTHQVHQRVNNSMTAPTHMTAQTATENNLVVRR